MKLEHCSCESCVQDEIIDMDEWQAVRDKRFASKVAAKEREKVAAWMVTQGYATGHGDTMEELLEELEWQIKEQSK